MHPTQHPSSRTSLEEEEAEEEEEEDLVTEGEAAGHTEVAPTKTTDKSPRIKATPILKQMPPLRTNGIIIGITAGAVGSTWKMDTQVPRVLQRRESLVTLKQPPGPTPVEEAKRRSIKFFSQNGPPEITTTCEG